MGLKPLIIYLVFGVDDPQPEFSQEKYGSVQLPEGLNILPVDKEGMEELRDELLSGIYADVLREYSGDFFDKVRNSTGWVMISGEVQKDDSLTYFRDIAGIIQAYLDKGAIGVLDLQIIRLYTALDWKNKVFEGLFNPMEQVLLMASPLNGAIWIHSRGFRKFGRPDIGIENVPEDEVETAAEVAEQMTRYSAQGAVFADGSVFCISGGRRYSVKLKFVPDFTNDDYNNAYYHINWAECVLRSDND